MTTSRLYVFIFFLTTSITTSLAAQEKSSITGSGDRLNYAYNGDETRVGIGIDNEGEIIGEFFKSFGQRYNKNWMGEGWFSDGAGGIKLSYHWIPALTDEQQLMNADNIDQIRVWKLFGAIDQNTFDDRKMTLGFGSEAKDTFWNINLSGALTDERLANQSSVIANDIITGMLDGRNYIQERSIETITRLYETPYDWGVGARIGHFFDNKLFRLTGGLDYEQGDFSSDQFTGSINLEKYFNNTGHSIALSIEQLFKNGDFETEDDDTRATLLYRYDFGKNYRPTTVEKEVEVVDEIALAQLKKAQKKQQVVQNQIDLSSVAFFDLDSAILRDDTKQLLDQLAEDIMQSQLASKITVIGHTCWLGTQTYNQELSEKRAKSAKQYLVSRGLSNQTILTDGKGEMQPAYNNEGPEMEKNRRVVISFLTVEDNYVPAEVTEIKAPMKWVKKAVDAPPAWINRALRNPALHKKTVDVYKEVQIEEVETLGEIVFINTPPLAENDQITIMRNISGVVIDVLNNDSDPDPNNQINITDISIPAHGTVTNNGNSLSYTPETGFIGTDTFTYTISDNDGETATATVTVLVENAAPDAVDDNVVARGNNPIIIDVLANDSDSDGTVLTVTSTTTPTNGTVSINTDSTINYQPNDGYLGNDSFEYTIMDADGAQSTATVYVSVQGDNTAPIAVDDLRATRMNTPVTLNVLENDSDADGDTLTIVSMDTTGTLGTIEYQADGTVTYTPPLDWCGLDTFTYVMTDGFVEVTATVTINVVD